MNKEEIASSELVVGMYVELGGHWLSHPFFKRSFLLKTEKEIKKIQGYLDSVIVDYNLSHVSKVPTLSMEEALEPSKADIKTSTHCAEQSAPEVHDWQEKNTPSQALSAVINGDLPAEDKAQEIILHSSDLMGALLSNAPSKQLIKETSQSVQHLAEFIVADDEVAENLLAITSHDYYTYTHSVNVGIKALLAAKHVLKSSDSLLLKELGVGFFLHDIGKSQVDPGILNKPGRLDDEEMMIMRNHPQRGIDLLREADSLCHTSQVITLQHHEKIDGTGYPIN